MAESSMQLLSTNVLHLLYSLSAMTENRLTKGHKHLQLTINALKTQGHTNHQLTQMDFPAVSFQHTNCCTI